jgi:hypothetical protein
MTSQKQIEANRLNAKKSTGPRTAAGKLNSSMNALKTGQSAKSRAADLFDAVQLMALMDDCYCSLEPPRFEQRFVVTKPVSSEQRGRKFSGVETSVWVCHTTGIDPDRLNKVRASHQRDYDEALEMLLAHRAKREAAGGSPVAKRA